MHAHLLKHISFVHLREMPPPTAQWSACKAMSCRSEGLETCKQVHANRADEGARGTHDMESWIIAAEWPHSTWAESVHMQGNLRRLEVGGRLATS